MFQLRIETDNAAFDGEYLHVELARILRLLADMIVCGHDLESGLPLRDLNGNTVGLAKLTIEQE